MLQRWAGETPLWVPRTARLLLLLSLLVAAAFTLGTRRTSEIDVFARLLRDAVSAVAPELVGRLSTDRIEFVANILLFVPLGVLLPPAFPRLPLTLLVLVPAALSLGIETAQLLVLAGRTPDAADVLANTTGGAVGLLVGADLVRLVLRRPG